MLLIKSLDDLLKVGGETLEGTEPRVGQLKEDEHAGSVNFLAGSWLDIARKKCLFKLKIFDITMSTYVS